MKMRLWRGRSVRLDRPPALIGLAALILLAGVIAAAVAARQSATPAASPVARCSATYVQARLHLPNVTVASASLNTSGSFTPPGHQPQIAGLPAFCDVALTETDAARNRIHIDVWLPSKWNGRFQGVGGAVYECGPIFSDTATAIQDGYASAATDCGVPPADQLTGSWALNSNGTLNWPLIDDFGYAGIHDMSVAGMAVTSIYYPSPLRYSYFNGCSTGGREGLMEAQRYPADYNGIVVGAPAINWTKFIPSEIWPELVMKESNDFLPSCIENMFTDSAVQACATTDGVITNPSACDWNPYKLVGLVTRCRVITRQDAAVMTKIWDGPETTKGRKLWYGLERGASLASLAATTTTSDVTTGNPFPITVSWLGIWLQRNPSWNWRTLTYAQFDMLFAQSVSEFSNVIATDNPDLSAFKNDRGKIIIWHGLADELIFPQGTVNYYQRVQKAMGGANATDSFARLFLVPAAQHCAIDQPLDSLVNWVEHGKAPSVIPVATSDPVALPLCMYPALARYKGAGSFVCAR